MLYSCTTYRGPQYAVFYPKTFNECNQIYFLFWVHKLYYSIYTKVIWLAILIVNIWIDHMIQPMITFKSRDVGNRKPHFSIKTCVHLQFVTKHTCILAHFYLHEWLWLVVRAQFLGLDFHTSMWWHMCDILTVQTTVFFMLNYFDVQFLTNAFTHFLTFVTSCVLCWIYTFKQSVWFGAAWCPVLEDSSWLQTFTLPFGDICRSL